MEDTDRLETFLQDGSTRKLAISIYYSAAPDQPDEGNPGMKYTELFKPCEANAVGILKDIGMNIELLNECTTEVYNTQSFNKMSGTHPVMIFSPALGLDRDMYMYNIQALVHQGFAVITISALHEAMFTVLPDGEFVYQSAAMRHIDPTNYIPLHQLIEIRKKDIRFILDVLLLPANHATDESFQGCLDLNNVVITGHSLGGIAALEVALEDGRIQACVLLDPSLHLFREDCARREGKLPSILLLSQEASDFEQLKQTLGEETATRFTDGQQQLWQTLEGYGEFISIAHATHMSFSDIPLFEEDISLNHRTQEIHKDINYTISGFLKQRMLNQTAEGGTP